MAAWTQTGSSIIFLPYTLEQALQGLSEAGFKNVEIGAVKDFLEHLDPDNLGPAEIANCQRLLDQYGLNCISMSGHAPLHLELSRRRVQIPCNRKKKVPAKLSPFPNWARVDCGKRSWR